MSFIAKNPISAAEIDSAPPSPIIGTRGFFPKPDGWYDIDSEGNEKKVVTYNDLKNTPMVITDLGTYYTWNKPEPGYSSTSDKYDRAQTALDETYETGVYKFDEIDYDFEKGGSVNYIKSSILLVAGGRNQHNKKSTIQIWVYNVSDLTYGDPKAVTLPRIRYCYYDFANDKYIWTDWSYDVYESSGDKSFGFEDVRLKSRDMSRVNINSDSYAYPTTTAVAKYVNSQLYPAPVTSIPSELKVNTPYNFGEVLNLNLTFPVSATDGDVVYLTFKSGLEATNLTIDTTNTSDIDIIPEANKGYEILGKYNGEIWIVNYSEYTVSEG